MADSTPSRPGLRQGGSDALELMLDIRGGEVITAYERTTVMADKHLTQTLSKGKSAKFPAFWRASASYHTPGVELTGGQIASQDITISPDDKLVSDVFIADVDEMLMDVNFRSPYTAAIGEALAVKFDQAVIRAGILAARGGALFTGDQGGSTLVNASYGTDATVLFDGLSQAKQEMDEKNVPVNVQPLYGLLMPAQWYLLARSDRNLNRDYNGGVANIQKHTLTTVDDIQIIKSNVTPFGRNESVAPYQDSDGMVIPAYYRANFTNTVGLVWTPYAMASAVVQDVGLDLENQPRKQGTLLIGRRMFGTRTLRNKCAVELASA